MPAEAAPAEAAPAEATTPLPSADPEPSPGPVDPSILPNSEDPQTSTGIDVLQLTPAAPSHTPLGVDIGQVLPNYNPTTGPEVPLQPGLAGTVINAGDKGQYHVTPAYQDFPLGGTPPFLAHNRPALQPLSPTPPMPIPIGTGAPVCFPFKSPTPQPDVARGDSI